MWPSRPANPAARLPPRALSQDLLPKIHALTAAQYPQPAPPVFPGGLRAPLVAALAPLPKAQPISSVPVALVIGVSTGGPAALDLLLPALPAAFPLPVLIVQHMPELFTKLFAERLNGRCPLQVHEAVEGAPVLAGSIHIAKGNWHMEVMAAARLGAPPVLRLSQGPQENHCRPAVDVLFRSAAAVYGAGVLAVVLTGMGSDGMLGSRVIRDHGGSVLAQDQPTSTVWGMPGAVANAGLAHKVLPLNAMAAEILRLASRTHTEARELRESMA